MTSATDDVTVVIAVRDGARFLAEALASVVAQTHAPAEIVVVDGRSTDDTVAIARAHSGVRVVAQQGTGIADAYNTGVREARGALVAFLSHDDVWVPEKLAWQTHWLREHPEHLFVTGHARFELAQGHRAPAGFRPELIGAERPAHIMETLLARREAFDVVGKFDERHATAEDVDWFARARDRGVASGTVPRVVVVKRLHDRNATGDAAANSRELLSVLRRSVLRKRESAQ